MPRPNPPRKRPRRRPDAAERSARAEVNLARQTAQVKERKEGGDAKSPPPKRSGAAGATAKAVAPEWVPWPRRSYAILIAVMVAAEIVVGLIAYLAIQGDRPGFGLYVLGLNYNPLLVLASALIAAPLTRLIAHESRSLKFMETLFIGVVEYFIWLALFAALTTVLGAGGSSSTPSTGVSCATAVAGAVPTPLPNAAGSATASPCPSAAAHPTASPSGATTATPAPTQDTSPVASPSASASASPSSTGTGTTIIATPVAIAGLGVIDVASFGLTLFLYPPVYKRLRFRPPPPRPRPRKDAKR